MADKAEQTTGKALKDDTPEPKPFPRREMAILAMLVSGSAAYRASLMVLLVYMVQSYGVLTNPADIGSYTGLLTTANSVGQLFTVLLWGWLSDKFGRKPWLVLSELVGAVVSVVLAFTGSFSAAVTALFLYGFFHSTVVVGKSVISELCDRTTQSIGFGIVCMSFGVGALVGPLVGGFLAEPCAKYFKDGSCPALLQRHPFALPFLVFSVYLFFAAGLSLFGLRESNPFANKAASKVDYEKAGSAEGSRPIEGGANGTTGVVADGERAEGERNGAMGGRVFPQGVVLDEEGNLKVPLLTPSEERQPLWKRVLQWLPSRNVMMVAGIFGLINFTYLYADPLFSIFAAAPVANGGLGYDSSTMGLLAASYGGLNCLYTLFAFPPLSRRLGPLLTVELCFSIFTFLWLLAPLLTFLHAYPLLQMALVLVFKTTRTLVGSTAYASTMMVVSNAAPRESIGAVIGLSMMFGSFIGSPAPAAAGKLWSYFTNPAVRMPFHDFVPWVVPSFTSAAGLLLARTLPRALNVPPVAFRGRR